MSHIRRVCRAAHAEKKESEPVDEEATLHGTEWVLSSLEGNGLLERSNIPLSFAEGRVSGFAGCSKCRGRPYTTASVVKEPS